MADKKIRFGIVGTGVIAHLFAEAIKNVADAELVAVASRTKENAEKFIDFMCRADIALLNFDYITYSTPNDAARALIEDEDIRNSSIAFPDLSQYELEVYQYLGPEIEKIYNDLWKKVGSANQ